MSIAGTLAGAIAPKVIDVLGDSHQKSQDVSQVNTQTAATVVVAEAQGESWLQRNWRPLVMLWFSFLIGAYWFGFVPVNMPLAAIEGLFAVVQLGLGGYVVGRSGEKIAKTLAPVLKR